jgi:hypothetical protein
MKSIASKDLAALPQKSQVGVFLGDQNKMIQMVAAVKSCCLVGTNSFKLEDMVQLCIAEEANLCQIKLKTIRSDHNNLIVTGSNFYVYATYLLQLGWVVRTVFCREGEDTRKIPTNLKYINEKALRIPSKSKWVALVLWTTNKETHGLPYQMMCEILKPYVNDYAMMNSILQDNHDISKVDLFGQQEDNVKYTYAIAKAIEDMGHTVELIFTDRRAKMQNVCDLF